MIFSLFPLLSALGSFNTHLACILEENNHKPERPEFFNLNKSIILEMKISFSLSKITSICSLWSNFYLYI